MNEKDICDLLAGWAALHEQTPTKQCCDIFSDETCPFDVVVARKVANLA